MDTQAKASDVALPALMYLPKTEWSPRYDSTFYSVKIENKTLISDLHPPCSNSLGGRTNLPAYYYTVTVYREHDKTSLLRRYSQFYNLYQELRRHPPNIAADQRTTFVETPIHMPPGTCPWLHRDSEEFLNARMEQLDEFLEDVLSRPGYANHPSVIAFLELRPV